MKKIFNKIFSSLLAIALLLSGVIINSGVEMQAEIVASTTTATAVTTQTFNYRKHSHTPVPGDSGWRLFGDLNRVAAHWSGSSPNYHWDDLFSGPFQFPLTPMSPVPGNFTSNLTGFADTAIISVNGVQFGSVDLKHTTMNNLVTRWPIGGPITSWSSVHPARVEFWDASTSTMIGFSSVPSSLLLGNIPTNWTGNTTGHLMTVDIHYNPTTSFQPTSHAPHIHGAAPSPAFLTGVSHHANLGAVAVADISVAVGSTHNPLDGVRAYLGATGTELVLLDGVATSNISQGEVTLESGSFPPVSAGAYTSIGRLTVEQRVTDHDGDSTRFSRNITVSTTDNTGIDVWYQGTTTSYAGEWLSTNSTADASRQRTLDIQGNSDIQGTYDLSTLIDGVENATGMLGITGKSDSSVVPNTLISGYSIANTPAAGAPVNSVAYVQGDHSVELSTPSPAINIFSDSLAPNVPTVVDTLGDGSWSVITANTTDNGNSGIPAVNGYYYQFVTAGSPPPTVPSGNDTGWTTVNSYSRPAAAGSYDLYVYAKDNATNRSGAVQANSVSIIVQSTEQALISGTYVDDSMVTQNCIAGTWVNKDVTLTVDEAPTNDLVVPWYSALYDTIPVQLGVETTANTAYTHTPLTANTPLAGTDYLGVLVDSTNSALSAYSNPFNVRIDKINPIPSVTVNTSTWAFADSSTDTLSGVDASKTQVAIVAVGTIPISSDYESITTATLPATAYWDIWVIATDNAGNESIGAKAYSNISQSEEDRISADNVVYDLDNGPLTDAQLRVIANVTGDYYGQDPSAILQSDIEVDSTELAVINTAITNGDTGIYDLTFSTPTTNPPNPDPTKSANTTIKVYLLNEITGTVGWSGHDFNLKLADITDANIKTASGVKAYDFSNLNNIIEIPVANITVAHSITSVGIGQPVTFGALGENYGVQGNIFDSLMGNEGLNAHDFIVPVIDANNNGYKIASGVSGWDITDPSTPILIPLNDINVDGSYVFPTSATPAHNVKFVTNSGAEIEVEATVITSNITINANDIVIDLATAQSMTGSSLLTLTAASATTANIGGNPVILSVPATELVKLTSLTQPIPAGITLQIQGDDAVGDHSVKSVKVHVFDNITGNVGWVGHNFNLQLSTVNDNNIKAASGVAAYDITTINNIIQVPVADITVTHSITTRGSTQPVTFGALGETYSVLGNIFDSYNNGTKEGMNANDFIIDVPNVNEANYKIESGVVAWDATDPNSLIAVPATDISVDSSYVYPIKATPAHNVTFITVNGTTITVDVTVYTIINLLDNEAMNADDFSITLSDVSDVNFIAAASAKAFDITTVPGVEMAGNLTISTPLPTTTGIFAVTFVSPTGLTSITVNATITPDKPTINPIYPGPNPNICGTGTIGNIITVTYPDGSAAQVTVATDGTWCLTSPNPLSPGEELKAIETDLVTNIDSAEEKEIVAPEKPIVNPVNPGPNPDVCGTGTPGNTITITLPDGSQLTVIVAIDGTWCETSPIPLQPGDTITVEQTDPNTGNISELETVIVAPEKPTINPINPGPNSDICGTGTPGNTIIIILPDGSQLTVIVATDGTWCETNPTPLQPGDTITAEQIDQNTGVTSEKETEIVAPEKPIINPIYPGKDPEICGTGTIGNIITVTYPDGTQEQVTVSSNGTWCTVSSPPLQPGNTITVDQTDPNTNVTSEKESVTVTPEKPVINPIIPGENPEISGEGTPGNTIIITLPDGSKIQVVVDSDGKWNETSPVPLKPGDVITGVEQDPSGNTSDKTEVTIRAEISYEILANDATITLSEYNQSKNAGTLSELVLDVTAVKVIENDNGVEKEVGPVDVDLSAISNVTINGGDQLEVLFTYNTATVNSGAAMSSPVANSLNNSTGTSRILEKKVTITIVNDALPTTGQNIIKTALIGLITFTISFFLILILRKNKNKSDAEIY